jgi:hypothetical protein
MAVRAINPAEGFRVEHEVTPDGWQWNLVLRVEGTPSQTLAVVESTDTESVGRLDFLMTAIARYLQAGGSVDELQRIVDTLRHSALPVLTVDNCFVAWMGPSSYGFQYVYVDKKTGGGWQVVEDSYAEPLDWSEVEAIIRTSPYAV